MDYYRAQYLIRADQIANEVFGDVKYAKEIIRLNPIFFDNMYLEAGEVVKLPKVEKEENVGVTIETGANLWS